MGEDEKKETTPPAEEPKKEAVAPPPPQKRVVIFELTADGFKILKNDCVSILEFRGLLISVLDALNRK